MSMTLKKSIGIALHALFAIGLLSIVVYVVYLDLDLDGVREIRHTLDSQHVMVKGPTPEVRVLENKGFVSENYWEIIIDPVYFHVFIPRQYDRVVVELEYMADAVPLIQLGGALGKTGWNFAWHCVQNTALDTIDWPCLRDEDRGWWLCQKNPQYRSIENFLLAPPRYAKIVNYNFALPEGFERLAIDGYNHETNLETYDYIIAKYTPPAIEGDWKRSVAEFSFDELYQSPDGLQFALSAPGIDDRSQKVNIRSITFRYEKDPMTLRDVWRKFKEKLAS